jgi:hypothetical protein
MKTKLVFLVIGIVLIALSFTFGGAAAQEPTDEPDSQVVVVTNDQEGVLPPADVVVIQPEVVQPEQERDTIAGIIEKLTVPIIAVGGFIMLMLSSNNRARALGATEVAEDIAWATTLGASELVAAFGGNPNVIVSTDPSTLSEALKAGDKHVLIRQGVPFEKVVSAYNQNHLPG